jgi:mutator protein MutT
MIEVCAAVIEKDGLVMAARRKKGSHLAGFWEFPGGKIEPGETPEECLARELDEELGITADIGAYIGESIHAYSKKIIRLLAFCVPHFEGTIQLIDHDEIKWLALEELDSIEWAPADIPLVNQYKAMRSTSEYYNNEADAYCAETMSFDIDALYYSPFLSKLAPNAHILDLGCGAGRDSRHFLQQGYEITALDASAEIAAIAEKEINAPIEVMAFSEIRAIDRFDGIWANASLLHCPEGQIKEVFRRLIAALKPNGLWFMSFKHGTHESIDERGRHFNNYTKESLTTFLSSFDEVQVQDVWENTSFLRGKDQCWVNAIVKKQRHPA